MINYPKQYKRNIKKQVRKMLKEGDNASVFTEKTLLINTDRLKVFDQFSSNTISKENIKDVKVYDDMFLIYVSSITAEIIPTRYLNDKSKKALIDFFKEKINL